eukprot:3988904-Pyramimonas_sp.AAC.1
MMYNVEESWRPDELDGEAEEFQSKFGKFSSIPGSFWWCIVTLMTVSTLTKETGTTSKPASPQPWSSLTGLVRWELPPLRWCHRRSPSLVGYGDFVPHTVLGKITASGAMLVSVFILALPITVIGTNFNQQWAEFRDSS